MTGRILVTGGAGVIARAVCRTMPDYGVQVFDSLITRVRGDLADSDRDSRATCATGERFDRASRVAPGEGSCATAARFAAGATAAPVPATALAL